MKRLTIPGIRTVWYILLAACLSGCVSMGATGDPGDPFESFNRSAYNFNEALDKAVFDPVIRIYQAITPEFLDRGISNMFRNINDIIVILNDILQLKLNQAVADIARFIFNTTIGLAGFVDVSTGMGLARHNEDFGQTLAKWGFGSGPYLVVPFMGPSTFRDVTGFGIDSAVLSPLAYVHEPARQAGLYSLNYIDFKADLLEAGDLISEAALDEYEFVKSVYINRRENLIHDRESTTGGFEDFDDPAIFPEAL